ncbi:hypothetical protein PYCCODRAFT_1523426 [Trametes coccinea BRFM310]|uniref:Alpha/beta hydrolase fold-3 domain-containing protein n=1 Tax=Trametes coccinea (strain BRFM310) TaxID=1353009 RepID=A0A1Y2IB15_TRAC3|nr:hypothetical protein PYCCODRAFT_1523426 [Trametes coccinea BRFM310]
MDPELAAAIASSGASNVKLSPDVASTRGFFHAAFTESFRSFAKPRLPLESLYEVHEQTIPVKNGTISVRCVIPADEDKHKTYPVLVNIHGGGWSVGNKEIDDCTLRELCVTLGLSTVNVGYRLAPEHPFPTAVDDCLAALQWTAENTTLLRVDLSKGFLVGGMSAGANLSAVVSHIARDDPFFEGRRLTGQLLREPLVCHPDAYPERWKSELRSIEENKNIPPVTREFLDLFFGWYNSPPHDPRFSPLLYPSHKGLPRAYIQCMELDPLRDDGVVYAKALLEAGVEAKLDLYPGVSHGFHYVWPTIKTADKVREDVVEGVKWLLNMEVR